MNREETKAYLERIGFQAQARKDEETLNGLIRAHLCHVPFENLDVFELGKVPSLEEDALFDKIVGRHRGGYCFEQNTLFLSLLQALGFLAYPVAARIVWNRDVIPPFSHMALVVRLSGRKYLCDVGYGGPGPKGLLCLEETPQNIAGESFRVREISGDLLIEGLHDGTWKGILRFHDQPFYQPDFQVLNFYCAANEKIMFRQKRVVNLCTPTGSKALTDMELTVRDGKQVTRRQLRNEEELASCLREEFGL